MEVRMRFFEGLLVLILGAGMAYGAMCYKPLREKAYSWQDNQQTEQTQTETQTNNSPTTAK